MRKTIKGLLKKWIKKLLAPIVREVIIDREEEIIETIRRVGFH